MDPSRLIRTVVLLGFFTPLAGMAVMQEPKSTTIWRPLLDDLAAPETPSLESLRAAPVDFRGCDGGQHRVHDFWTYNVMDLYAQPLTEAASEGDARKALITLAEAEADFRG